MSWACQAGGILQFVVAVWFLTITPTVTETITTWQPSLARAFSLECTVAGRDSVVIQRRSDDKATVIFATPRDHDLAGYHGQPSACHVERKYFKRHPPIRFFFE